MKFLRRGEVRGLPVLVAEDSPTQAAQLRHLLEERGYQVTVAANGREALEAARRSKPGLLLSDVVMPEMDGYTLCRQIKSDPELKDLPVILVTSLSAPQDVLKGLQCGADNFITKPYNEKNLVSRIEYILANREVRSSEKMRAGIEVRLAGETYFVTSERQQILDLLISTYEEAVRINEELRRSHRSLQVLYRVAESMNTAFTEREVVERALDWTMRWLGVQTGWIVLLGGERGVRLAAARGLRQGLEASLGAGADCPCLRELLSGELKPGPRRLECELLRGKAGAAHSPRFNLCVPLRAGARTIGVMSLAAEEAILDEEEMETLRGVGSQIAVALERAELLGQLERKVEERTTALRAEIAERERAQEALRESEACYRELVMNAPHAIFRTTPDGKFLNVNPAFVAMLGRESERELLALDSIVELYRNPGERTAIVERLLRRGRLEGLEVDLKRKDGAPLTFRFSSRLLNDAQGRPAYIESIGENITDRRVLEEQLRQAQKMEAVGKLAGGVAHDFNNLLNVILGYSTLALERLEPSDPVRKHIGEISKAADRAAALTRQLLAFSRKQVLEPKVLDLNAIVTEMDKMLRRLIREDIELVSLPAEGLGRVKADPGQVEQILMNLVVNARDAMPHGGNLTIETGNVVLDENYARQHLEVTPGPHVMLAVSDTGHGMAPEIRTRIFEPFFTTKEQGKGTGLGLATVFGIVKQSGGSIWVYSEPGQGTAFKVYFPRFEGDEQPAGLLKKASQILRGSETILLVEDEESLRRLAREFLEASGYRVIEAQNSSDALRISEQHQGPIHLMLTDVVMPGLGGQELAERLAPARPETKVLYISGYTEQAINQHGVLDAGAAFLQKPFTPDDLRRKVREVLEGVTSAL